MNRVISSFFLIAIFILPGCAAHNKTKNAAVMSPVEIQKAWEAAGTPGKNHKLLRQLAGNFSTQVKFWFDPGQVPEQTKGSAKHHLILGGRFLQEHYSGNSMGKEFKGTGLMGYDNVLGKFVTVWTDSMSSGLMFSSGNYNPIEKSFTFDGEFIDPATKEIQTFHSITKIISKTQHSFEMWNKDDKGEPYKALEIIYTRVAKKAADNKVKDNKSTKKQSKQVKKSGKVAKK